MNNKSQEKKKELEKDLSPVTFSPADFGLYTLSLFGAGFWGSTLINTNLSLWSILYLSLFIICFIGFIYSYSKTKGK